MKIFILVLSFSLFGNVVAAKNFEEKVHNAADWNSFQIAMEELRLEDRKTGFSYLISGGLVTIGGFAGAKSSNDTGSKLIFGLSQGLGIAAMGYGVMKLSYGNDVNSFYESVRDVNLTPEQRNTLVRSYVTLEKEKREMIRRVQLFTHLAIGTANLYSSTQETDRDAKAFLQFLAGVNFAFAFAYAF